MKIGTDMSLKTCWEEGYMIMDFKVKELFPNGRKNALDKDAYARFYRSDGHMLENWCIVKMLDTHYSYSDLLELYQSHKEGVDSFCGYTPDNPRPNIDNPREYDMLNLASDLDAWCGLE